jgi:hypothetical protein
VGKGVQRRAHHLSENMIEGVGTLRFAHPEKLLRCTTISD